MIKRFQVTDPPMFWLVSRVVRPSRPRECPLLLAIWPPLSPLAGRLFPTLVATTPLWWPPSLSSPCQSRVTRLWPPLVVSPRIKQRGEWGGGTDDHFMKPRDDVTGGDARQRNRDVHAPLPLPSPFHSPSTHIWFLSFFLFERRNGRDGRNLLGWRDILVLRSRRYNVCVCVTTKICPLSGRKKIRDKGRCKLTNLCW